MAEPSKYRISVEEFDRRTPKVHPRPVDPGDPDGEMEPATAFVAVEQPEPPPNPNLIEGMIAGIGRIGSVGSAGGTTGRRAQASQRGLIILIALPFLVAVLIALFH